MSALIIFNVWFFGVLVWAAVVRFIAIRQAIANASPRYRFNPEIKDTVIFGNRCIFYADESKIAGDCSRYDSYMIFSVIWPFALPFLIVYEIVAGVMRGVKKVADLSAKAVDKAAAMSLKVEKITENVSLTEEESK